MKVIAILTCHNRREATLTCLESLYAQRLPPGCTLDAVLVDDGSTDGTAAAVRARFPRTRVVEGDGQLYWARGMALAERVATAGDPDSLLWLNDDVVLEPGALAALLERTAATEGRAIVVGALRDPWTGEITYSGVRRAGMHPLRFERLQPSGEPISCDTFNGNVALVPRAIYEALGGIDDGFEHAAADFDYGLRARCLGFDVVLASTPVGTCPRTAPRAPWLDPRLSGRERWGLLLGPKGLPPRSQARYLRRHGGLLWPLFWLSPYAKAAAGLLLPCRLRWAVLRGERPDDRARHAGGDHARRDRRPDDAPGADHAPPPNRDAAENERPCADEDVVFDRDAVGRLGLGQGGVPTRHAEHWMEVGVHDHDI